LAGEGLRGNGCGGGCRGGRRRWLRSRGRRLAGTTPGAARLRAVPDEVGTGLLRRLINWGVRLLAGRTRHLDGDDRGAHLDGVALGDEQLDDLPREGDRQFHERLGGLDLDDEIVDRDLVALPD